MKYFINLNYDDSQSYFSDYIGFVEANSVREAASKLELEPMSSSADPENNQEFKLPIEFHNFHCRQSIRIHPICNKIKSHQELYKALQRITCNT